MGTQQTTTYLSKVLALHAGSRGFDSHRGHMSKRFFRSNRPGYPHPVSSELENSGIRVASALSNRQNCACARKHYKHDEDGRTAPGVCGNGSVPLSHSGNVVTRIEIHTHTYLITRIEIHTHTYLSTGRTHGTPYRGYGYVPLRFEGTSLGEWEHNDNLSQYFSRHQRLNISCRS